MGDSKDKEKRDFKEWVRYKIDNAFAGGPFSQFIALSVVIIGSILIFGPITALLTGTDLSAGMKSVYTHLSLLTTIVDDDPSNVLNFILMIVVTIVGVAFYSTFIGIITNAITSKVNELQKGHSRILEEGHVVILGFSDSIHTILNELGQSNENWPGNRKIVIIDDKDKTQMEDAVTSSKKQLIFRSGDLVDEHSMYIASVDKARTIIINSESDFDVVRTMLSLVSFLKKSDAYMNDKMPAIVVLMHDPVSVSAAKIAAGIHHDFDQEEMTELEKKIRILYFDDILSHLFAQSCRQPGLSWVITEMFDYTGSEIYIEDKQKSGQPLEDALAGKSLKEINAALVNSVGIGIQRGEQILINPDPDEVKFRKGDKLIHMANDDNEIVLDFQKNANVIGTPAKPADKGDEVFHFLLLGWSAAVPDILEEIKLYSAKGSTVDIMSMLPEAKADSTDSLVFQTIAEDPSDFNVVYQYLEMHPELTNIVIVADPSVDKIVADQKATILLLNVREYLKDRKLSDQINVTTEITLAKDQKLLSEANHNDFIVGSEIANRMLVQIANNPKLHTVFTELLSDEGSEFYLRPLADYVDLTKPFNYNFIVQQAMEREKLGKDKQEIVVGWMRLGTDTEDTEVHINPLDIYKEKEFSLRSAEDNYNNYRIVVVAMD